MTLSRSCVVALAATLLGAPILRAQSLLENLTSNINIEGIDPGSNTTFDPDTGIASASGGVRITYGDTVINAGRAEYNSNTGDVIAREKVTVWKAGTTYKSENLVYNIKTGELTGNDIRSSITKGTGTLLYATEDFETETKFIERIDGNSTYLTTHDVANPNFHVTAKQITIYPEDRVVMKGITVYAGKTPVFWLPYVSQPLDDEVGYTFTPGYSSNWGAFLLNQYGVIHGDHTLAKYKLDLRSSRGVAGGVDFISMRHRANQENFGTLKLYYANDSDPTLTRTGGTRDPVDADRYRVNFQHRIYLPGPEASTWYLDFDINKMSDIHFYEDFFFEEFRSNREPDNQISLIHADDKYVATLEGQFQINDFYRATTRLPELSVDFTRQPIFNSGFFYQGNTSAGILQEKFSVQEKEATRALIDNGEAFLKESSIVDPDTGLASTSPIDQKGFNRVLGVDPEAIVGTDEVTQALTILRGQLQEPGYTRLHSYHEFLYPKKIGGWLNVVPRVGAGLTYYSDIEGGANQDLSTETKALFHIGLDMSFKLTKTWENVQSNRFGLDGLRHVVQPYINYSYLNADETEGFPSIDRLAPTTRPRSIDVPLFSAVDDLRTWNIARVGVRNVLQTRRDYQTLDEGRFRDATTDNTTQTYTWAGLNTYVDVFMDDPEFDRDVSNLYNELFWRPVPWFSVWADTQLPIGNSAANFTEVNHGFTFLPTRSLSFTIGHQYMSDHPLFQNSSLFFTRIYARLNENWGVSMNHVYEADDSTLEYQSYSVHRDLSSWTASLGALVRDSRNGVSDYGMVFSLTLKEFPQVSIPLDTDPNPTGRGGKF
ncbi:MAG: LPS-assembly protein LptD [Verrucomicrobiales bacterium]|nr:LPS-assembly protein LptD [Verrucomicrobiales bacterium]MCP5556411.1 LPS-assembly protein LptD [Verrucomicrobiaceae bacterium]